MSKELVTLKNDVPIKTKIESFISENKDKLYNFWRNEFNRLLSQVISFYRPNKKGKSRFKFKQN